MEKTTMDHAGNGESSSLDADDKDSDVEITCFTDFLDDVTLHFQIIRLRKQETRRQVMRVDLKN
ncbi:hypothetical protein Dimus_006279 [Dionaea muscipula]